jgi:membrane protein implicated in regulation of membrane protease activity
MSWIIWIIAAVLLGITEMVTASLFFFLCLGAGAILAGIASACGAGIWVQVSVFSVMSLASVLFIRPILRKYFMSADSKSSNIDEVIGKDAVVIEKVSKDKHGLVKVIGEVWGAFSEEGDIEQDSLAEVIEVKGTRLVVRKK